MTQALKSETSGSFGKLCCAIATPPAEYDAQCVHDAMKGVGTDEDILIEGLAGRSNSQVLAIRDAYQALFNSDLEHDISKEVSGKLKNLFVGILQGQRAESSHDVDADVETLYKAGEGKLGTNGIT
jgi:annexin A7/11